MRKNCSEVLTAFIAGHKCQKARSIWTDGKIIYSYNEPIVSLDPSRDGHYVVTNEKFSHTTTVHTNSIYCALMSQYKKCVKYVSHEEMHNIVNYLRLT